MLTLFSVSFSRPTSDTGCSQSRHFPCFHALHTSSRLPQQGHRETYPCNMVAVSSWRFSTWLWCSTDAEQSAHVLKRLQQLEQAVTEQVVARRQAEQILAETQGRITQLSQTFQQGAEGSGQVIDTLVLGKPDKWDGSEKAWPNWSFVAKAYTGVIDQQLSDDMSQAEICTTVLNNDRMSPGSQARSVQLLHTLSGFITRRLNLAARSWHGPWSILDRWLGGSRGVCLMAKRRTNVGIRRTTARR